MQEFGDYVYEATSFMIERYNHYRLEDRSYDGGVFSFLPSVGLHLYEECRSNNW